MPIDGALAAGLPAPPLGLRPSGHGRLRRAELRWALAFIAPYAGVLAAFVVYPFGYALWLAGSPSLYAALLAEPLYLPTVVNTLCFVVFGVNLTMFLALVLSGFFLRDRWWIRALFPVYLLPWLIAAAQACVAIHWMLIGKWGLVDGLWSGLFGTDGPDLLDRRWSALGADIGAYIWKWLPFWTLIFLAGRITIPRDIYDAAAVDGATGLRRFRRVTVPLLANLYLICTLLFTLLTVGEFTTVYLVSGGGPAFSTEVLATLGARYAFDYSNAGLGVAAMVSVLPVLIVCVIVLARRIDRRGVEL
jgi:multiple sugar transport system permease protein